MGHVMKRRILLPSLSSSYDLTVSRKLDFGDIYDVQYFIDSLKADGINISEGTDLSTSFPAKSDIVPAKNRHLTAAEWEKISDTHKTHSLSVDCTFNSIKIDDSLVRILWKIDRALVFGEKVMSNVRKITTRMPVPFTALHFRIEDDWVAHCKHWESIDDGIERRNCMSNTDAIDNVFALEGVPTSIPVYIAGAYRMNAFVTEGSPIGRLRRKYSLYFKDMFFAVNETDLAANREVWAAVDYAICSNASLFIGNSVSTFSASIELRRIIENRPVFHYNGGPIPLKELLPLPPIISTPKPLKWVFTLTLSKNENVYHDMVKVALLSALKNTLLKPVCLVLHPAQNPTLLRWMKSKGVVVIEHKPAWANIINELDEKRILAENQRFSPLYGSASALISTFMRIDIPILGFVDDFVLYTDVDVLFLQNLDLSSFGELPRYYTASTETIGDNGYMNAGVVLYNVINMRWTYNSFLSHVFSDSNRMNGLHFKEFGPGDQGAYNSFYRFEYTPQIIDGASFNWRPYWKSLPLDGGAIKIVHWHGPKPPDYFHYYTHNEAATLFSGILSRCDRTIPTDLCWQYYRIWSSLLQEANSQVSYDF